MSWVKRNKHFAAFRWSGVLSISCLLCLLVQVLFQVQYARAEVLTGSSAKTKKVPDSHDLNALPAVIKASEKITICPPGAAPVLRQLQTSGEGSFKGSGGKIFEQACRNRDGNFNGSVKRWFGNGQLFTTHSYRNGLATGEWKSFFPNGNLANKTEFVEREDTNPETANIPKVTIKSWYRSGKPACEYYGLYQAEEQRQRSKVWDQAGQELAPQKYYYICGGDADSLLAKECPALKNCK